jgi:hypothetical protein
VYGGEEESKRESGEGEKIENVFGPVTVQHTHTCIPSME